MEHIVVYFLTTIVIDYNFDPTLVGILNSIGGFNWKLVLLLT